MSEIRAGTELIESFWELLRAGFRPAEGSGVCQFCVTGSRTMHFYVEVAPASLACHMGQHSRPTTSVTMPEALLASVVDRPHLWDLRNPEVAANVVITGDIGIAMFLGKIAKTPAKTGVTVFEEAEGKARARSVNAADIELLSQPTREEIVRRLSEGIPFIMADVLSGLGAWMWPFQRIRDTFAHLPLDVSREQQTPRTVGQFFDDIDAGRQTYTHGVAMPAMMRPHFRIDLFPPEAFNTPLLWMGRKNGPSGTEPCTALHRDTSHGFLGQIRGVKRIVLVSPDQAEKLYPERAYNVFQSCAVKLWQPDYERFPLSRDLHALEVMLHPGQVLVIPAGWFHEVYCDEPVMSVGTFMNWRYWRNLLRSAQSA